MTHNHHHKQDHDHHHGPKNSHNHTHSNDHGHSHSHTKELSFEEKLATLFAHWIDHNNSHMENFLSWAKKANHENLSDVARNLEQAGELSQDITQKLEDAVKALKKNS